MAAPDGGQGSENPRVVVIKTSGAKQRRKPDLTQLRKLDGLELRLFDAKVFFGIRRYKRSGSIIRLNQKTILKRGNANRVRLTEALTLDFIARHTSIPVPRTLDVFFCRGETWLVMEYIDAPLLVYSWWNLNEEERLSSMHQLKGYIDQLRALEPPSPGKVQAVDGGSCIDSRMAMEPWGPFDTIKDFHTFCGHDYVRQHYPEYRGDFEKTSGRVHRTVFTHGDLGPHNILWRDGKIVAIIDWETAGWLPEYWEYTRGYYGSLNTPSWWDMYERVMEPYPDELEVEQVLATVFIRA